MDRVTMLIFLGKLSRQWYVGIAAAVGFLDLVSRFGTALGVPLPNWPIPLWAIFVFLLATIIYGAYSLHEKALDEGRAKGKAEALAEGMLEANVLGVPTSAYPGNDVLYVFVYLIVRSSGLSAVRITGMRLADELQQTYQPMQKPDKIPTLGGDMGLGPGRYFGPSEIVLVEPNKPLDVAVVFVSVKPDWARMQKQMLYTLIIDDDRGRSARVSFSCPIQYFEKTQ